MVELFDIPSGVFTERTIEKIHGLIKSAKTDYQFINLIRWIVRFKKVPAKDSYGECKALYDVWKRHIRYFFDPFSVELISSVYETIKNRAGDCDDFAILLSASFGAIGYQTRLVTIKSDPQRDEWSHIFVEVFLPRYGWVGADATVVEAEFGWRPPDIFPKKYWYSPKY